MKLSNEITTVSIKFPHGEISEEVLLNLANTMKKYQIPQIKISGAKGLVLAGVKVADVEAVRNELNVPKPTVNKTKISIQTCAGNKSCVKGLQDAKWFSDKIEKTLKGISLPSKLKIAVSACDNCCAQSMVRDLGFIAQPEGWTITAGGITGGVKPRVADIIATGLDEKQALDLAKKVVGNYITKAKERERIAKTIERIGLENFML